MKKGVKVLKNKGLRRQFCFTRGVNKVVATYPRKSQKIGHAQTGYQSSGVALWSICREHKTVDQVEGVVAEWR